MALMLAPILQNTVPNLAADACARACTDIQLKISYHFFTIFFNEHEHIDAISETS